MIPPLVESLPRPTSIFILKMMITRVSKVINIPSPIMINLAKSYRPSKPFSPVCLPFASAQGEGILLWTLSSSYLHGEPFDCAQDKLRRTMTFLAQSTPGITIYIHPSTQDVRVDSPLAKITYRNRLWDCRFSDRNTNILT
jgi:hypothetical protein